MKNQNDMIFSIVAVVLMLIAGIALYATMPEVPPAVGVQPISTTLSGPPAGNVVKAASLPGGGGGGAGGAGGPVGGGRMGGGLAPSGAGGAAGPEAPASGASASG